MIIVVATIQLAEGQLDAFLVELRKVVPQVLAEDGCLEYQPTVDASTEIDAQDGTQPRAHDHCRTLGEPGIA